MEPRFQRQQLGAGVAEHLRRQLIFGQIAPGTHLAEEAVARSLGVSRGPVREALRELEQDGLVETPPNGRTTAVGLTAETVVDLYLLRRQLELLAVEQAAERATDTELAELDEMVQALEQPLPIPESTRLDLAFHRQTVILSKNRSLRQVWDTNRRTIGAIIVESLKLPDPAVLGGMPIQHHKQIAERLIRRDVAGAQRAVHAHIDLAVHLALARYREQPWG